MDVQVKPVDQLKKVVDLAHSEQENKKGDKAVDCWIKATALARIVHGGNHWFYAFCCVKTGQCYLELLGLPEQSLQHVQEGKEILESLPPVLRDESSCLHALSLANCIFSQILLLSEQLVDAEKCLVRSEKFSLQYGLTCQVDISLDMKIASSFGRLHTKQKKHDSAESYFQKALDLHKALSIKDCHDEIILLMDIAEVNMNQEKYKKSIARLNEAQLIASECFGEASEEKVNVMVKLCKVYATICGLELEIAEEDRTKLEDTLWSAYNIYTLVKGPSYHKALSVQDELVKLLIQQSRHEEAIKHLKDLIINQSILYGEGSVEVSRTRKTLASVYLQEGLIEKASEQLKMAREVFTVTLGVHHRDTTEVSTILKALTGSVEGKKAESKKPPFKNAF